MIRPSNDAIKERLSGNRPTVSGDVLILETDRGLKIHAVGRVTKAGQRDFHRIKPAPLYMVEHTEAVSVAQTLVGRGGRIFLVKIDNDHWTGLPS